MPGPQDAPSQRVAAPDRRGFLLWAAVLAGCVAAAWLLLKLVGPPQSGVTQFHQLLRRDDVDGAGLPSWDGRYVPYRTTDGQMFLLEVSTGKSRLVTKSPAEGSYGTFTASPDGSAVAYDLERKDAPAQLHIVDAAGSQDRMVFTDPQYIVANPRSWSPDGKLIAAMLWKADRSRDLAVIDAKSGAAQVLYSSRNGPANPQFSPDGRWVAFNEKGDVWVIPASGGAPAAAVSNAARDNVVGWAPDGRLIFVSDRSGTPGLFAVKLRDGRPDGEPELLQAKVSAGILGATRTGSLFYSQGLLLPEIYQAGFDSSGSIIAGPAPLIGAEGQNREPDYSRDGRLLAYISGPRNSTEPRIRVRTLASGEEQSLAMPIPVIDQLRWYPDGKALLLRGKDAGNHYGFFRLEIQPVKFTSVLTEGVPNHAAVNASFSPDGKYLYYLALPGPNLQVLMRLDLNSGASTEVYRPTGRLLRMFALSAEGTRLALQERDPQAARDYLFVKPLAGGTPRMVDDTVRTARAMGALSWSADGKSILYARPDDSAAERDDLMRISLEGKAPQELVKTGVMRRIAVQPGGSGMVWQAAGAVWEISAIENLFPSRRWF